MCPVTGLLAAAGTAGQIVIAEWSDTAAEKEVSVIIVHNVALSAFDRSILTFHAAVTFSLSSERKRWRPLTLYPTGTTLSGKDTTS